MTTHETGRPVSDDPTPTTRGGWRRGRRLLVGSTLLAGAFWTLARTRLLNWGATTAERERALPGDDLLPDADAQSTMAVSIDAPPDAVWPWLVQLGQERGGFYSHEWAENLVGLDIHNADRIVPAWQDLEVGDTIRLGRTDRYPDATLEVASFDPERSLVLLTPGDPAWWVWAFVLKPGDEGTTRLLVRSRIRLPENPAIRLAAQAVLEPVTFVMTHGMLRGLRIRAERLERGQVPQFVPDEELTP